MVPQNINNNSDFISLINIVMIQICIALYTKSFATVDFLSCISMQFASPMKQNALFSYRIYLLAVERLYFEFCDCVVYLWYLHETVTKPFLMFILLAVLYISKSL